MSEQQAIPLRYSFYFSEITSTIYNGHELAVTNLTTIFLLFLSSN